MFILRTKYVSNFLTISVDQKNHTVYMSKRHIQINDKSKAMSKSYIWGIIKQQKCKKISQKK